MAIICNINFPLRGFSCDLTLVISNNCNMKQSFDTKGKKLLSRKFTYFKCFLT